MTQEIPQIYLDYQSTTPTDARVVAAMLPWFTEHFGNPHSTSHRYGTHAAEAVDAARARVAGLIGAEAREIIFTSGATESNNLAIKGAARFMQRHRGKIPRIVTLATEHKCVLEACRDLETEGCIVTILPVCADGSLDLDVLDAALAEGADLVSVMAAHNEIGVIQDLAAIGARCRAQGVLFHTDAAQAYGKIPLDVGHMAIDLLSISGHKIYGPKGIGALYVRHRPRVRLEPLFSGGGQERGLRSGTLSPPLCVGLGEAAKLMRLEGVEEAVRLAELSAVFRDVIASQISDVIFHGAATPRLPGNVSMSIPGIAATALLESVPELALSTGSACSSASVEPSYVLRALGLPESLAHGGIRIGFGRFTTIEDVRFAALRLSAAAFSLR